MLEGALLAESLRNGISLEAQLSVSKISRTDVGDVSAGQPLTWTFIHFTGPSENAHGLATGLSTTLDEPGWYCDFRTERETFVIFSQRIFSLSARRPKGPRRGRGVRTVERGA